MPRSDPTKSFDAAVRHLFRHLDDASELRRNPLIRSVFVTKSDGGRFTEGAALAAIRALIREASRICLAEDIQARRGSQGRRQCVIVDALCSKRSASDTARELGLSLRQFYYDRRAITNRIGRLFSVLQDKHVPVSTYDPLELILRRASLLVDQGFAASAIAECKQLLSRGASDRAKVSALLQLTDATLEIGDLHGAVEALQAARQRISTITGRDEDVTTLDRLARLMDYRIAVAAGKEVEATPIITNLVRGAVSGKSDALRTESVIAIQLDWARFSLHQGRIGDARAAINEVTAIDRRNGRLIPAQRAQLAWLLSYAAEEAATGPDERLQRFNEALECTTLVGSARGVVQATLGLANYHAALGRDDQAKTFAQHALRAARAIQGAAYLCLALVGVSAALLHTKHWRIAAPLLLEAEAAWPWQHNALWAQLKLDQGTLLSRVGNFAEAVRVLREAEATTATSAFRDERFLAHVMRELALALQATKRIDEARACMRRAVDLAESSRAPLALRLIRHAAPKVLNEKRFLLSTK